MRTADDYLAHIKARIALISRIVQCAILREEAQGDVGMLRYRIDLDNGDLVEVFEHFRTVEEEVVTLKYSFHWQDAQGHLRRRWDNAAHHPELSTFPHHIHVLTEDCVEPHRAVTMNDILDAIAVTAEDMSRGARVLGC